MQSLEIVVHKQSSKQIVKYNKSHSTQQEQQQRPIAMKALQEEEITPIHQKKKTVEKVENLCAELERRVHTLLHSLLHHRSNQELMAAHQRKRKKDPSLQRSRWSAAASSLRQR
ncbi:unnamed protein product [Sphagnum troendelagicum]|uniref:Uncharacterized protein n=1 Tax=Sphagnum troendelagicum TaxID=128251 RepID=A0ABP0U0Q0_9BRYO